MKLLTSIPLILLPSLLLAQGSDDGAITALVKKLNSASFQAREDAANALKKRPDAEPAVREAARSDKPETRRRALEILDYYERRPLRDLDAMAKGGRFEDVIKTVADWPAGKYDEDVWATVRTLSRNLKDLHEQKDGEKMKLVFDRWGGAAPVVLRANRITETTKIDQGRAYFLRANEVDLASSPREPCKYFNDLDSGCVIVASGTVRLYANGTHIILARGSVRLAGRDVDGMLVVSGGDVELDCKLYTSLIIARGKVTSTMGATLGGNRIISGKAITLNGDTHPKLPNIITENETNPLGFIRWADAPKEKPAAQPKK